MTVETLVRLLGLGLGFALGVGFVMWIRRRHPRFRGGRLW